MTLVEQENWQQTRVAILEFENDAIYLYSYPSDDQREMKSLWVANSKKRLFKKSNIKKDLDKGLPPYLPHEFCNDHGYIVDFNNENDWRLQWGLDQNSIAVWFKGEIVAIMPEWSGINGFCGYSIGVVGETPVAWALEKDNIQIERFKREEKFLDTWSEELWIAHQEALLGLYDQYFQGTSRYFSADGGKWPPLGLHCSSNGSDHFLATVGLSQLPMPSFAMQYDDDVIEDNRRIELAIRVKNVSEVEPLAQYLSGQATYPWYWGTHFDEGHTIPCAQLAEAGSGMSFMVFVEKASFIPELKTPRFDKNNTKILFMVPIYESEQRYAEENTAGQLITLLEKVDCPFDVKRERIV